MKKIALAACLLGTVAALSACASDERAVDTTERTTSGSTVMERSVTK